MKEMKFIYTYFYLIYFVYIFHLITLLSRIQNWDIKECFNNFEI